MGFWDTAVMLCKYAVSPRRTGAVCPSSRFLARKMVSAIAVSPEKCGAVVELGSGTGAITAELVRAGYADKCRLYCIEFDPKLCSILREKFPAARVVNGSAENIRGLLGSDAEKISAIVSGLPLVSLPGEVVRRIISEVEAALPQGGRFAQFTYSLARKPEVLGFSKMRHLGRTFTAMNIPPARVDVFEKI